MSLKDKDGAFDHPCSITITVPNQNRSRRTGIHPFGRMNLPIHIPGHIPGHTPSQTSGQTSGQTPSQTSGQISAQISVQISPQIAAQVSAATRPSLPISAASASQDRNQLRREMRALRRAVTDAQQSAVAIGLARMMARLHLLRPGRHVAVYIRQGREADLSGVIALAQRRGCRVYLPVITHRRHHRMEFVRFDADMPLRRNVFGILEPDVRKAPRIAVRTLDLVLVPLVAVDSRGARIGSGAGFYDRRLHHLQAQRRWRRPKLIGVAYEFQRIPQLEAQPWDVPLDAVITDRGYYPTHHLL